MKVFPKCLVIIFPVLAFAVLLLKGSMPVNESPRPNIILITADDMGFSDLGSYGGEIPTPNLDRLAYEGMRFTQFYNAGRCVPTRGSLLTGLYPHQAGLGASVEPGNRPGYLGRLNEKSVTFAEVLKRAGYQTYMSGKWHVTHYNYENPEPTLHPETWPLQRGFDRFFGTLSGAGSYYAPVSLMRGNEFIEPGGDFYYTDAINDRAVKFIEEADEDQPILLYVAHVAPHWPLHAPADDIKKFKKLYEKGWDRVRAERYDQMVEEGLIKDKWVLPERNENVPKWEEVPHKSWHAHRMAVYAAQVNRMDRGIGQIIEALKKTGRFKNSLILFISDNGASHERIHGKDTRHGHFEQGGTLPRFMPGKPDTYASYGPSWGNVSNTPFRLFKTWMHEGGIASPFIAHWPGVIPENKITRQPGHVMDLMATFVDITGAKYPSKQNGYEITPMVGKSLLPVFKGNERNGHDLLYWEQEGNKAVRSGKWKLVTETKGNWELYNMEVDRTETNNLIEKHHEKAKQMAEMWREWAERTNVK